MPRAQASYATKSLRRPSKYLERVKRSQRHLQPIRPSQAQEQDGLLAEYRELVQNEDLKAAMAFYSRLAERSLLEPIDVFALAKLVHTRLRNDLRSNKTEALPYVDILVGDIRSKRIPPYCAAHVHLISCYKIAKEYEKGHQFWQWLASQKEDYVDPAIYGAIIELLAYQGEASLQELEEIYSQALKRFPGTFAEYHLSAEAITQDRAQPTTLVGLPMTLLQGILTARLLYGDWKNAYLALGTALRLYPTQVPARLFELFAFERPVAETYTVFLIACRGGHTLKPDRLTALLNRLKTELNHCAREDQPTILRGMVVAMYAYLGAGGTLQSHHLSSLVSGYASLIPDQKPGVPFEGEEAMNRNLIVFSARRTLTTLIQAGVAPGMSTFGSLLSLGGRAMLPDMLSTTLTAMSAKGFQPNTILHRILVTAAGRIGHADEVERRWNALVTNAESEGTQLSIHEWAVLARACQRANHESYLKEQTEKLSHTLTDRTRSKIKDSLEQLQKKYEPYEKLDPSTLLIELESINNMILQIAELAKSGRLLDFFQTPVPMFLDPARSTLGSMDDLRMIYDELTTDPKQPPADKEQASKAQKGMSPTGFPLDELRFEDWIVIMELLHEAEAYEAEKKRRVDAAIAAGQPVTKTPIPFVLRKPLPSSPFQTSTGDVFPSLDQLTGKDDKSLNPVRAELRRKVLHLRGIAS